MYFKTSKSVCYWISESVGNVARWNWRSWQNGVPVSGLQLSGKPPNGLRKAAKLEVKGTLKMTSCMCTFVILVYNQLFKKSHFSVMVRKIQNFYDVINEWSSKEKTLVRSSRWELVTLLVFPSLQEREEWRRMSSRSLDDDEALSSVVYFDMRKVLLCWSVDQYNNVQKSGSGDRMSGKKGVINITLRQ